MPKVSILLPIYNNEKYLRATLDSLFAQTFPDFELLAMDDGSTDQSPALLEQIKDSRLRVIRSPNRGQTPALNSSLALAQGDYLARMDADDISDPGRLAAQVAFLDRHPDIGIVGTAAKLIGSDDRVFGTLTRPPEDAAIRWHLLFGSPFFHPAVMMRADILKRHRLQYDPQFKISQDYDLWIRLLEHTKGANLPEFLFRYRVHNASAGSSQHSRLLDEASQVAYRHFKQVMPSSTIDQETHGRLYRLLNMSPRSKELPTPILPLLQSYLQIWRDYSALKGLSNDDGARLGVPVAARVAFYWVVAPHGDGLSWTLVPSLFRLDPWWPFRALWEAMSRLKFHILSKVA